MILFIFAFTIISADAKNSEIIKKVDSTILSKLITNNSTSKDSHGDALRGFAKFVDELEMQLSKFRDYQNSVNETLHVLTSKVEAQEIEITKLKNEKVPDDAGIFVPKKPKTVKGCPPLVIAPDTPLTHITAEKMMEYKTQTKETFDEFNRLWQDPSWMVFNSIDGLGDVKNLVTDDYGKLWGFTMTVDAKPCLLILDVMELLMNPTVETKKMLIKIDDVTGIAYLTAPPYPMIEPRDFVDLYLVTEEDGKYFFTFNNIEGIKDQIPGFTRAQNHDSGIVMEPIFVDNEVKTNLTWIINNDYKLGSWLMRMAQVMFPQNMQKMMLYINEYASNNTDTLN